MSSLAGIIVWKDLIEFRRDPIAVAVLPLLGCCTPFMLGVQ